MKKILIILSIAFFAFANSTNAQIKVEDIIGKVTELLGKKELLTVKKGFNPVFSLGKLQIKQVGLLG